MSNKNITATFITYCIALVISWFIWGHTTDHIWTAWLFLILLLAGIIAFISMIAKALKKDTFDSELLFAIAGIVFFDLFLLSSASDINLSGLLILAYIFSGFLFILLVFTGVRYFLHQNS